MLRKIKKIYFIHVIRSDPLSAVHYKIFCQNSDFLQSEIEYFSAFFSAEAQNVQRINKGKNDKLKPAIYFYTLHGFNSLKSTNNYSRRFIFITITRQTNVNFT